MPFRSRRRLREKAAQEALDAAKAAQRAAEEAERKRQEEEAARKAAQKKAEEEEAARKKAEEEAKNTERKRQEEEQAREAAEEEKKEAERKAQQAREEAKKRIEEAERQADANVRASALMTVLGTLPTSTESTMGVSYRPGERRTFSRPSALPAKGSAPAVPGSWSSASYSGPRGKRGHRYRLPLHQHPGT